MFKILSMLCVRKHEDSNEKLNSQKVTFQDLHVWQKAAWDQTKPHHNGCRTCESQNQKEKREGTGKSQREKQMVKKERWNEWWRIEEVKRVKTILNGESNGEEVKKERRWSSEKGTKVKKEVKKRSLNVSCDILGFG